MTHQVMMSAVVEEMHQNVEIEIEIGKEVKFSLCMYFYTIKFKTGISLTSKHWLGCRNMPRHFHHITPVILLRIWEQC
jgi:hypothetical protein